MRTLALLPCLAVMFAAAANAADDEFVLTTDQFDDFLTVPEDAPDQRVIEFEEPMHRDRMVRPVQAQSNRGGRSNTVRTASRSGRSRVPYMIGDSPYGEFGPSQASGLSIEGFDSDVSHPAFGGNRFNAAEAGTFLPQDRVFFTYRHMHNVNTTNILGQLETNDIDRFVLGFEKTALDGMISAELRVPLLRQLDSDLNFAANDFTGNSFFGDRDGEFGNMSVNFKALLTSRPRGALAAGVAVNIPTAEDLSISQNYDTGVALGPDGAVDGAAVFTLDSWFANDTVNLVPYVAWALRPTPRLFHQGFLQIDVPLNSSGARVDATGDIFVDPSSGYGDEVISISQSGEFFHQTLLRMNLGFGYWITQGRRNGMPSGIAALFEVHYTTSLDDPPGFQTPLASLTGGGPDIPVNANAGAGTGNFDVVNLSTGLAFDLGTCVVTNGFIVPVSSDDRFFDFEYNLQVNKRF